MEAGSAQEQEREWRRWLKTLGARCRQVREFLGLSQEEIGRLSGVSQGAVSRFEGGRGLATPFVVVLRIQGTLARLLATRDPATYNDDVRLMLRQYEALGMPDDGALGSSVTADPALDEWIHLFQRASAERKKSLLVIARAVMGTPEGL